MVARLHYPAFLLVAAPLVAVAASSVQPFANSGSGSPTVHGITDVGDAGAGGDNGQTVVEDSGASADGPTTAAPTQGSPLCNYHGYTCYPDDPLTAKECGFAPDAGAYEAGAGYDNTQLACRVQTSTPNATSGEGTPTCGPAGSAGDGSWCKSSSECAPTYDCVGAGTCQRYCCSGNAECVADQFCDIQPTIAASGVKIPVCMPVHPAGGCTLLDPTSCPATETCAVVRDDGSTSCVGIGSKKAGEECDTEHCGGSLVCLGTPGQRRCYQLCHTTNATSMSDCSTGSQTTCKGGLPLFQDPSVGVCQ
jgi:hypothetical protein